MASFDSDGVDLYFEETGEGPAIIWLHEFAADFRTWEPQVRRFSRDYRCVTLNARGYPPSAVPESAADYGLEHQRDDVVRLMDHLGVEQAHLVGLSMGAYTGLQVLLAHPQRVRSLVFSSGGSGSVAAMREEFLRDTREGAQRILLDGMEAGATGLAYGATRVQLLNKDPRGWAEFRRFMSEHSALGSALTLQNYQMLRPSVYDYEKHLSEIDVPVLLAVGDEDDPVLETNLFLKRTMPRAGMWVNPQTGHGINVEEPDEYNRRLADFWGAVERGTWRRRDARARPGSSVFIGDKQE